MGIRKFLIDSINKVVVVFLMKKGKTEKYVLIEINAKMGNSIVIKNN